MCRADIVGMLDAAASVGSTPTLHYLIHKVRSAATCSELYGSPLTAAAANGQLEAATFIFAYMKPEPEVQRQLWYTIKRCMKKHRTALLPTMLEWFFALDGHCTFQEVRMKRDLCLK